VLLNSLSNATHLELIAGPQVVLVHWLHYLLLFLLLCTYWLSCTSSLFSLPLLTLILISHYYCVITNFPTYCILVCHVTWKIVHIFLLFCNFSSMPTKGIWHIAPYLANWRLWYSTSGVWPLIYMD
jgi:hypothetical protein